MNSWSKSVTAWSKFNRFTSSSTTRNIVSWFLVWVTGFGYASSTAQWLDVKGRNKLGPKFYGPFRVLERVREVAYKLELPEGAWLHNVFHVGLLKATQGRGTTVPGHLIVH
jgi:hypothetical protein